MKADRKKIINGYKIEECYWAGRTVCYVDDRLSNATFDENVALLSDNSGYEAPNAGCRGINKRNKRRN